MVDLSLRYLDHDGTADDRYASGIISIPKIRRKLSADQT